MTTDVAAYLSSKGVQFKTNSTQIITQCFIHGQDPNARDPHLYINNTPTEKNGLYECKSHGCKGNFRRLQQWFGDDPDSPSGLDDQTRHAIVKRAAEICFKNRRDVDTQYLVDRGLTEETINRRGLGWTPGGTFLWTKLKDEFKPDELLAAGILSTGAFKDGEMRDHFFGSGITIPYFAGRTCVDIRWRNLQGEKPKYLSLGGAAVRLFNANTTYGSDVEEIVVCEGEFDAMLLEQLGYHAVAVPGATNWDHNWGNYFQDAKRVWLMYDPDEEGVKGADRAEAAIGAKARIISLPVPDGVDPKKVDPSYLVTAQNWTRNHFDFLLKQAKRESSLLRTPSQAFAQLEEDERVGGILTGWEIFDKSIGGLKRNNLIIPVARTNVGKTMFLLNMLQRMSMVPGQEDLKFLLLTLEQTGGQWADRARRIWNFFNVDCDPADVHAEAASYWDQRLRYVEKNQLSEAEIRGTIEDFEIDFGQVPDVICVDYLGYLAHGFPGETTDRAGKAANTLKGIAKELNRPIVVPSQASRKAEHGKELSLDDARDSGEIENVADIVIGMHSADTMKGRSAADRTGELINKFLKTRGKGKGKEVKFFFAPLSLVWIPENETQYVPLVKREIGWDNQGDLSWQEAINAHRTGLPPRGRRTLG